MILNFGVIDVPYALSSYGAATKKRALGLAKRGKATAPKTNGSDKTTGDVATILENKYHIFEIFAEDVGQEAIAAEFENAMAGAMENIAAGAPAENVSFSAEAEANIETMFRKWLGAESLNGVEPGVPTQAAINGVNHRLLHPYARSNPSRPSFIDTGLYQANAKVWLSD